jgi:hypothetical protein
MLATMIEQTICRGWIPDRRAKSQRKAAVADPSASCGRTPS